MPGMADRTPMQRTAGQRLVAVARIGELGQHRHRRWRRRQEPAAHGELGRPAPVAEQAVVTDALETVGQDVQQEAPEKLVGPKRHHLLTVMMPVVLPAEGDAAVLDPDQPAVGNSDAVGVAAEILEHLLRTVPSGLAPKCAKTTKAGASWMGRNHYIW